MINTTILIHDFSTKNNIEKMEPIDLHPGFLWNEVSSERFENNLSLPYFKEKFDVLLNTNDLKPFELANEINTILLESTKVSKVKEKKIRTNTDQKSEPWFDSECKKMKNELRSLGNKLSKSPNDSNIRTSLCEEKRNFKRTIVTKKRHYKRYVLSQIESKRHGGM